MLRRGKSARLCQDGTIIGTNGHSFRVVTFDITTTSRVYASCAKLALGIILAAYGLNYGRKKIGKIHSKFLLPLTQP